MRKEKRIQKKFAVTVASAVAFTLAIMEAEIKDDPNREEIFITFELQ